ncbi:MAG: Bro-N domain-containing protein [Pseudomonas sp.]|uniref:BRO-N domain-containing protein n=1 Tax=Pseudomonas TaxID=286 RepID=UPI0003C07241|nr:BRO family protein [Pseudomonas sp. VLB120]AGZ33919.1 phage-like protein [Pseudomonas sp. VLB120]
MGIELDVLVGHPEHDLLFVAFQVAEASGLKNAKSSVSNIRIAHKLGKQLGTLVQDQCISLPIDASGRRLRSNAVLFSEPEVYRMLMTGHAPQSEPFRRWVTEEVLPTIRKTGQYNAAESSDPIAMGIMDELKLLRGELVELKEIVKALGLPVVAKAPLSTRI